MAVGCLPFLWVVGTPSWLHMDGGHPILPFVWMASTSSGPSWGWWAVAVHPTSLRVPTCLSVVVRNRKDMGVGSPSLVGVRLVMVCIANSIRSSLIKVNVQGLTSKVNAGSCTTKNPWKLPRVKSLKYQGGGSSLAGLE